MAKTEKFPEMGLGSYHPVVSFSYFSCIIGFSLLFVHPVYAAISLVCALIHAIQLGGKKAVRTACFMALPVMLFMAISNLLFNHYGETFLFYINYNPITLESLMYGVVAGTMMAASIMWFFCYNEVVTSDKFLYIFGKLIPSVALIASMALRLVPKLMGQVKVVAETQRTLGLDYASGSIYNRAKSCVRILSVLVTWSLEDAVTTADSMRARAYGFHRRSNFSIFIFSKRDVKALCVIALLFLSGVLSYVSKVGIVLFYPVFDKLRFDFPAVILYAAFLLLGLLPVFIMLQEEARWKFLK